MGIKAGVTASAVAAAMLSACTPTKFSAQQMSGDVPSGTGTGTDGGGGGSGGSGGNIPVVPYCSYGDTLAPNSNKQVILGVTEAPAITLSIYQVNMDSSNNISLSLVFANSTVSTQSLLLGNNSYLSIPSGLSLGYYTAVLCDANSNEPCDLSVNPQSSRAPDNESYGNLSMSHFVTEADVAPMGFSNENQSSIPADFPLLPVFQVTSSSVRFLSSDQGNHGLPVLVDSGTANSQFGSNGHYCVVDASPLVLDPKDPANQTQIVLSSPSDGVKFDILGNGKKSQISWPVEPEKAMFLALPDETGQIHGINQLFGNNTVLPNGEKAANGFQALAYYAQSNGEAIVPSDEIYSRLRLWQDLNRDGMVEPGELLTLQEENISSINLNYFKVFQEDQYGNQTRERSTVTDSFGMQHMIVDIWFMVAPSLP